MKQILIILSILLIGSVANSQTTSNTVITEGESELQKSLQTHLFVFQLPETVEKEKLNEVIENYERYLDVKTQENNKISVQFKEFKEAKVIMLRFFKSLSIAYFDIDGKVIDLMTFNKQYLMKVK